MSVNYNLMSDEVLVMLANILEASVPEDDIPYIFFAGDDTVISFHKPGLPVLQTISAPDSQLGRSFYLVNNGIESYENLIGYLENDPTIRSKVGRHAIEKEIEKLLRSFRNQSNILKDDVITSLKLTVKCLISLVESWKVVIPVDNLELQLLDELKVGRVTFYKAEVIMKTMLDDTNIVIDSSSAEGKIGSKKLIEKLVEKHFTSTVTCAFLIIDAEKSRLPIITDDEVDAALNLLRCYTPLLFPREHRNYIGLRGEVTADERPYLGLAVGRQEFFYKVQTVGALYPFTLSKEELENLKANFGFQIVSDALAKSSPTKFEERILVASRWLGRGIVATDSAEKVLNLSIALERLLGGENKENITDTLSQRIAFVLGREIEERKSIYRRMKKLYGLRSKVVHEGRNNIDKTDLLDLEEYACSVFVEMIHRISEWNKPEEFYDWVENQVFFV